MCRPCSKLLVQPESEEQSQREHQCTWIEWLFGIDSPQQHFELSETLKSSIDANWTRIVSQVTESHHSQNFIPTSSPRKQKSKRHRKQYVRYDKNDTYKPQQTRKTGKPNVKRQL
ncbi:unnamed protein product [Didymodactylos carnosus]|uniref:Uncharacterized protein n=1 Tax=Didymodactylos carnosus TaxID=1234261 RepID=A0A815THB6_9BILA|nr:unnamed protein product [Didymodactylos carnosus]CAF4366545.1 unnamed protein product [Didymodactylos carnosus]